MQQCYETTRLRLSLLTKEYASEVLTFYKNNKDYFSAWEPAYCNNFFSLKFHEANLNYELEQAKNNRFLRLYLLKKEESNKIIGCISFQNISNAPFKSCTLGYKLDHNYTGKGFATEAITKGISIMFEDKHIHRIEALINPMNTPSSHLIEKLGFQFEGIAKSSVLINKKWTDHLRYALINPLS